MSNNITLEYTAENLNVYLDMIDPEKIELKEKHKINYYNVATSFDIETTSSYDENGNKIAFMYIWQFDFDGAIIYGRTITDMLTFFERLATRLQLNPETKRLVIYVHNLAHEFSFICKYFKWVDIFALDVRKINSGLTSTGLMFKCSYILTNMSLETVAKNLATPMKKLVGELDYQKVRLTTTPITPGELAYCLEDVKIVVELIREKIADANNDITKIPLTATGYVRQAVRKNCLYDYKKGSGRQNKHSDKKYKDLIAELTITPDEYTLNKQAFMGGFTHANSINVGLVHKNVYSYDITSSYPAVMLSEQYPMSKGIFKTYTSKDDFETDLHKYCMIFEISMANVELKNPFSECYLSSSKCSVCVNPVINNGRIASAEKIKTVLTNIDFELVQQLYTFTDLKIGKCVVYEKNYLPDKFIASILEFYVKKTRLKGIAGSEKEYMNSKSLLNSCYGMSVTDIVRPEITYDNEKGWETSPANMADQIEKYNKSKNRFLFYPWGVFVTAYARRNLFKLILETGTDFIYSDTDSVKFLHREKHLDFINRYNDDITRKIRRCLARSGLDPDLSSPVDIKGVHHPLGVYDCETDGYARFKALGAKRYLYEDETGLHLTCAGVNKKAGANYLFSMPDPFTSFSNNLLIPANATGKLTHTYIDTECNGTIIDYLGNTGYYYSASGVHLEPAEYNLSISSLYTSYTANIQQQYYST